MLEACKNNGTTITPAAVARWSNMYVLCVKQVLLLASWKTLLYPKTVGTHTKTMIHSALKQVIFILCPKQVRMLGATSMHILRRIKNHVSCVWCSHQTDSSTNLHRAQPVPVQMTARKTSSVAAVVIHVILLFIFSHSTPLTLLWRQ